MAPRSDHGTSAPQMLQAAASAAGAPLVASPYPQSYLQYNPQQYGQQQVLQAMSAYPGQVELTEPSLVCSCLFLWFHSYWATYESIVFCLPPQPMYSMLQSGARMISQGAGPHPQALGPPGGPQFPAQGDGPQGPQQGIYGE